MKKKIRILIVAISSLLLTMLIATVFAAYTYVKDITLSNKVGVIDIDSKSYYNYAASTESGERQAKLRKDTVAVLDGIILSSTSTYLPTEDDIFINGKTYYIYSNGTYTVAEVEVGALITSAYYEEVKTYNGISKIGTCYGYDLTDITPTISTNVVTLTANEIIMTITATIDSTNGVITEAAITVTGKNYKAVIDADGLGMVIIDTDITSSTDGYAEISADSAITCSASSNKYSGDSVSNKIYLSQLGLHFAFTSEVAVYVRIHIQDAWKRTRVYASSTKENYVLKDQISGQSPFTVSDSNWYYDNKTNCVYLREMYVPTQNVDGTYPQQAYTFNVNEAYYYNAISTSAYTEYVDVQVSFTVDVVQANRAKALWGVDPSTIVSN
ncbi:MAG: hypothetical protein K6E20_02710 [Acholeplasmatales bacterium]|nr:hypothetical protein [Acholeplasmatales bacterium]